MLKVLDHPLIAHKLALMRNKNTCTKDFRHNLDEIAGLMVYEVTSDLKTIAIEVETPLTKCQAKKLEKDIVLIPILRAGLGMVDGIKNLIPNCKIGHIGLFRDEESLQPQEYYAKFPAEIANSTVLVLDPMLATGNSASAALNMLKKRGIKDIKLVCLLGAVAGVNKIQAEHPDVQIYLAALDEKLNEKGYIVPGLGDAGDRLFGTM